MSASGPLHRPGCRENAGGVADGDELVRLARHVEGFRRADPTRCAVAPHPDLNDRLKDALTEAREAAGDEIGDRLRLRVEPTRLGLNDGTIVPPEEFPAGTPLTVIRSAAADRAPLRGSVRVIVVLVQFSDKPMNASQSHFHDLFFSTGTVPTGSVRDYYSEVTNGLVTIDGDVVGPYTLPQTLATYANGASGLGAGHPNATTMARDAVIAADPNVNFDPYDNDGNGFVDAFIVIHAGSGAEVTGSASDIWSHKWTLDGGARSVDHTKIFSYLTVPEDALTGVCAHELGHLLFGWPDLYDTDGSSEGVGSWCLMGSGSWNGGGNTPGHPCCFLKVDQAWATATNPTTNGNLSIPDIKDTHSCLRLWKDGASSSEYFMVENRQLNRFDADLPGGGLLIWHIDESIADNRDENHYRIAVTQADGRRDLEHKANRGDDGDPFPGSANNTSFTVSTTPNSKSYAGVDTCVAVTGISASAATMTADVRVRCVIKQLKERPKELKDLKERRKERPKELKEGHKELKDAGKELKELAKEHKELKEGAKELKEGPKELKDGAKEIKEGGKEIKESIERPGGGGGGEQSRGGGAAEHTVTDLEARVSALEAQFGAAQPFIGEELRPDLSAGAYEHEEDSGASAGGGDPRQEKHSLDTWRPGR